ncbi:MAG: hypothetical protein LBG31_00135 [Prevotellaceae bacterium]|jgi:hypothetical protein|nr:hypothetical protein [Prevotellaceae bacterium]
MRTTFFFLAMFASVATSAQVTHVEPTGANYVNKTVSFRVWWNAGSRDATHLSKVWVWIDYITVNSNNTISGNTWTRATVGTISPTTGISYDGSNRNGFWLEGSASTNYSATLTVQLTNAPAKFNWCTYASDCPPTAQITSGSYSNGTYTLKGTKPFVINGASTVNSSTYSVERISSITGATQCPGYRCSLRDEAVGTIGCCSGLTAIGNYCRDLIADDASTLTACGFEIKNSNQGIINSFGGEDYLCPSGWRYPDDEEGKCVARNHATLGLIDEGPYKRELIVAGSNATWPRYISFSYAPNTIRWQDNTWGDFQRSGYIKVRCVRN